MTRKLLPLPQTAAPFRDDGDYLEHELTWLKTRIARIAAERHVREAAAEESDGDPALARRPGRIGSREARCLASELRERERTQRQDLDARLDLHRRDPKVATLGLDLVCQEASLSTHERVILIAALGMAVSQTVGESILADHSHHWGSLAVSDAAAILDPTSVSDWLQLRRLFRPSAPLVQHGLIEVNRGGGPVGPDTLMSADMRLSLDCFARITGDPDALTEGD